jgi:hypothetical protein
LAADSNEHLAEVAVDIATGGGSDLVRKLAEQAGSRSRLEEARDQLVERLEKRSDDLEASRALELVLAALPLLPPVEDFESVVGYDPAWEKNDEGDG